MSKNKPYTEMRPLLVERDYTYKAVHVGVRIDFRNGQVTLIDQDGSGKKWLFQNREIEYMQGWQDILDAMKYAIGEATVELTAYHEERKKDF